MPHPFHLHGHRFVVLRMGFAEQFNGNGTLKGLNKHLECLGKVTKLVIKFVKILFNF